MNLDRKQALDVESRARTYLETGTFGEPYIRVTFVFVPPFPTPVPIPPAYIDSTGQVPLPPNVPITFDCKAGAANISNFNISLSVGAVYVYWTVYSGFEWQR